MALEITDNNIEGILTNNKVTVIDFWALWCGPCKILGPIIEDLASDNTGISIGKLNVDDNPITASKYKIIGIPSVLFFKNGEVVDKMVGVTSKANLQDRINKILN